MANPTPIDPATEHLILLSSLPDHAPRTENNKKISRGTVNRWMRVGVRGVRLATYPCGGRVYTSTEAFARFNAEIAAKRGNSTPAPSLTAGHDRADQKLVALGF